jgi:hypothetical protein
MAVPRLYYLHRHRIPMGMCTANKFPVIYYQKRFDQASFPILTEKFLNRIIIFGLELCYSVEKYSTKDAAIQLSA